MIIEHRPVRSTSEPILVVMGVAGVGKTTLGKALAARLGCDFQDGDALHPPGNVAKMQSGEPLTDLDRGPWLDRVHGWIIRHAEEGRPGVIACSALKHRYRDRLARGVPGIVFLAIEAEKALLAARLRTREGHFMPEGLLASQLADYEPPASDEPAIFVQADQPIGRQVEAVVDALRR